MGRRLSTPLYTLAVVASEDGFIARAPDHPPQAWASPEEQAIFFAEVEAADWSIMGRNTHLAADKPERRRIILSRQIAGWRRPTQLWLDASGIAPSALPKLVNAVRPLERGLVLGGTAVHDWFHAHGALNLVRLTIEPVRFGAGLPIFTDAVGDPLTIFLSRGYAITNEADLNAGGTRLIDLVPGGGTDA